MSYKHITIEERACIKKMKNEESSIRAIARYLNRSPSTISRELKRNKGRNGVYHPVTAQRLYFERKDNCGRKISINHDIQKYINDKIDDSWSPEQIYFRAKLEHPELCIPSFSTIYRWIHLGLIAKGDMNKTIRMIIEQIKYNSDLNGIKNMVKNQGLYLLMS